MEIDKKGSKAIMKKTTKKHNLAQSSSLEYSMHDTVAPIIRNLISTTYPKNSCVLLGNTTRSDIEKIAKDEAVIYTSVNRSAFDVAKFVAHVTPHCYPISHNDESYSNIVKHLLELNGILHLDKFGSIYPYQIEDKLSSVIAKNHSILIFTNLLSEVPHEMSPDVIRLALSTEVPIIPIGNELYISNKQGKAINYAMYENYKKQSLFRPSDNRDLERCYKHINHLDYSNIAEEYEMEYLIHGSMFQLGDINFSLEDKLNDFLAAHPKVFEFYQELSKSSNSVLVELVKQYLMRCTILYEYDKMVNKALDSLKVRLRNLSDNINNEISIRHPRSNEEINKLERNNDKTPNDENDSDTIKILLGIKSIIQDDQMYESINSVVRTRKDI